VNVKPGANHAEASSELALGSQNKDFREARLQFSESIAS
jgi:hypothetical protein